MRSKMLTLGGFAPILRTVPAGNRGFVVSLHEVASRGARLETLEALRGVLAASIDAAVEPKDVAPLASRLQSVLKEIDDLKPADVEGDVVDQIAERRASRRGRSA